MTEACKGVANFLFGNEVLTFPGKKVCGPKALDKVIKCICESGKFKKSSVITSYTIEKMCGIDHNQAEACLETLEAVDYGQICREVVPDWDERSGWELVRLAGKPKRWLLDPPEHSYFNWWLDFIPFAVSLTMDLIKPITPSIVDLIKKHMAKTHQSSTTNSSSPTLEEIFRFLEEISRFNRAQTAP